MTNTIAHVEGKGGNQYLVKIGKKEEHIDLDGFNIMSDEDYEAVEATGLTQDDMMCPKISEYAEIDPFFKAAVEFAANYSGFDAERYIADNQ